MASVSDVKTHTHYFTSSDSKKIIAKEYKSYTVCRRQTCFPALTLKAAWKYLKSAFYLIARRDIAIAKRI